MISKLVGLNAIFGCLTGMGVSNAERYTPIVPYTQLSRFGMHGTPWVLEHHERGA